MEMPGDRKMSSPRRRGKGYASPSIVARRHRILNETRKMIAEDGIVNLSMDEVSRRAEVAKRTLYNAFQSKEQLIAAAIQQYFEDYAHRITYSTEEATLERALERMIVVGRRNLLIKNYVGALINIYFAQGADREIRQTIHDIVADSHAPLVRALARKRQLQSWIDPDELIDTLTRLRYSVAHAWTEGLIDDEEFISRLARSFLIFLAGATRGAARSQVDAMLKDFDRLAILESGPLAPPEPLRIAAQGNGEIE